MKKEAFWTFLEHKSEEFDKVSKEAEIWEVTPSPMPQTASTPDAPERLNKRRRQDGHPRTLSGGGVTASDLMVTPSDPIFLYILFDFSFIGRNFVERKP